MPVCCHCVYLTTNIASVIETSPYRNDSKLKRSANVTRVTLELSLLYPNRYQHNLDIYSIIVVLYVCMHRSVHK